MIYACKECGFLFQRSLPQSECPFCEQKSIREVTPEEERQFQLKLTNIEKSCYAKG